MSDHNSDESSEIDEDLVDNIFANEVREARIFVSMLAQNRDIEYLISSEPRDIIVDAPADSPADAPADTPADTLASPNTDSSMSHLLTSESAPNTSRQVQIPSTPRRHSGSAFTLVTPSRPYFSTPPAPPPRPLSPTPPPRPTPPPSHSNQRREFTTRMNNYRRQIRSMIQTTTTYCDWCVQQIYRENQKRIGQFRKRMLRCINEIYRKVDSAFNSTTGHNSGGHGSCRFEANQEPDCFRSPSPRHNSSPSNPVDRSRRSPERREALNNRIRERETRRREESKERASRRETPVRRNYKRETSENSTQTEDFLEILSGVRTALLDEQFFISRRALFIYTLEAIKTIMRAWDPDKYKHTLIPDEEAYNLVVCSLRENEQSRWFLGQWTSK